MAIPREPVEFVTSSKFVFNCGLPASEGRMRVDHYLLNGFIVEPGSLSSEDRVNTGR
ncbi:MAG: hypothetical protein ACK5Q5_14025 [Planctomycetaceae bacterium]